MSIPQFKRRSFLQGAVLASAIGFFLQDAPRSAHAIGLPDEEIPSDLAGMEDFLARAEAPMYILETKVPETFSVTDGNMEISDKHGKVGANSLQWDFTSGSELRIDTPLKVDVSEFDLNQAYVSDRVPHFSFWVYNEVAQDDTLRVEFCTDDKVECWFDYHLNFTGWRTGWVRYGFDTQGMPTTTMNQVVIRAPKREGTLWLDQIITNNEWRGDHAMPDDQVPFVQSHVAEIQNYHWLGLRDYRDRLTGPGFDGSNPTAEEISDIEVIRQRLFDDYRQEKDYSVAALDGLEKKLAGFSIPTLAALELGVAPKLTASGPFSNGYQADLWPKEVKKKLLDLVGAVPVRKVMDLCLPLAQTWDSANRAGDTEAAARAAELYLRAITYLFDQGWSYGSAQGTVHHFGYQWRDWTKSMYIAQDLLAQYSLWDLARNTITWYAGTGRLTLDSNEAYSGLIDVLNTLLLGLLISCVIPEDQADQVGRLRAFGEWINFACEPAPGLTGGFKPDGSMYHHMGFYMAYGRDALDGAVPVIAVVNGTTYGLVTENAEILRTSLMLQGRISNNLEYPIAFAGRHPHGKDGLRPPHVELFGILALRPLDPEVEVDRELAGMFRWMCPADASAKLLAMDKKFADMGIEPVIPHGYWQYGYGAAAQSRQDVWNVTVRGHNRYTWTAEIYAKKNLYGRYQTYGNIEIQACQDENGEVTHAANGWIHPGWDWRRMPGATTIQLPIEQMAVDMTDRIEVMPMPRSPFGGGGALANHAALFGMDLEEHPFFNASHRARISAFLVGNKVHALGSRISNDDADNATYTTLFQMAPEAMTNPGTVEAADNWIVDPGGNGFVVLEGALKSETVEQTMPAETGKESGTATYTHGWIDHGKAPDNSGYAYTILVQGGQQATADYAADPAVAIIQHDETAHVVKDIDSGIASYTLFEADTELDPLSLVRSSTRPALVLTRPQDDGTAAWSITDPDLHLFEGEDEEQYDDAGNYVGDLLPYSRPWRFNPSPVTSTAVTLAGQWELVTEGASDDNDAQPRSRAQGNEDVSVTIDGETTIVTTTTADARSVEFVLRRVDSSEPSQPQEPEQPAEPPVAPTDPTGAPSPAPGKPSGSPTESPSGPGGKLPQTGVAIGTAVLGAGLAGAGGYAALRARKQLATPTNLEAEVEGEGIDNQE
ncbi:MAG: chondroitinase family polysaccharide lyase [Actinomycetaceae bacterium]|nr:chondroitinase family polysaccharide lyase [Actinomycetaceae bacterium]